MMNDHDFDADMAYLAGLADFMFETIGHHLRHDTEPLIYDRLLGDLSSGARHAVSPFGWTIDVDWDDEVAA